MFRERRKETGIIAGTFILVALLMFPLQANATTYIVGDSRTVGMYIAVGSVDDVVFVSLSGAGYTWMVKDALPMFEEDLVEGDKIVIAMGVNDTRNFFPSKYVAWIDKYAKDHPDCKVYYVSVNPVDEDDKEAVLDSYNIDSWNDHMKENLPETVTYINTHDNIDFSYSDWLHYDIKTNKAVYEYIMACVMSEESSGTAEGEAVLGADRKEEAAQDDEEEFDLDAYLEYHRKKEEKKTKEALRRFFRRKSLQRHELK